MGELSCGKLVIMYSLPPPAALADYCLYVLWMCPKWALLLQYFVIVFWKCPDRIVMFTL
jgi:hypothetical protein